MKLLKVFTLAMCLAASACATVPGDTLPSIEQVEYRIAPGDTLQLTVFREESLSGEFQVGEAGLMRLPLVGNVEAGGKTIAELRADITARLSEEFLRDPNVSVTVTNYRPVYVLGEVANPGQYVYAEGLTVHALVARAGGFSFRAQEKIVHIRHAGEADERAYALTSSGAVRPGDTVRIGARYF